METIGRVGFFVIPNPTSSADSCSTEPSRRVVGCRVSRLRVGRDKEAGEARQKRA